MSDVRQAAYLDAMGIDVWRLRETGTAPVSAPTIKLGPGSGGVLILCAEAGHTSSRLANDISRALGGVPVWAWPQQDNGTQITDAVNEHLFTNVAIMGEALASQFFDGPLPANLGAAKLVLLPSMEHIQTQAGARKELWQTLCKTGMVNAN